MAAANVPPRSVGELLALGGLEAQYARLLTRKGYEDLEFLLSASDTELERLAKDTGMSTGHLGFLRKAVAEAVALVRVTGKSVEKYCEGLRVEESKKNMCGDVVEASAVGKLSANLREASLSEKTNHEVKHQRDIEEMRRLEQQFEMLIKQATDTSISAEDQKAFRETGSGPTYGYMTWDGVNQMLCDLDLRDKVFYDLGSGIGRPVFAAAMQFPMLKKAIGIELSSQRHGQAQKILSMMEEGPAKDRVKLLCGNLLENRLQDADIVYISSLCFSKAFIKRMAEHFDEQLKPGAIVLCSKECSMERARLDKRPIVAMSWNQKHQLHRYIMLPRKKQP